jgi:PAS domain S-box-containing protein
MDWKSLALLLSSISSVLAVYISFRKSHIERSKIRSDIEVSFANLSISLLKEIEDLRTKIESADSIINDYKGSIQKSEEHEKECRRRLSALESILPFVLLNLSIDDIDEFVKEYGFIIDQISEGFVITSPVGGGTFIYVNISFCSFLKMSRQEVLSKHWENIVAPEHLNATRAAEALGHIDPVQGFVNQFIDSEGKKVTLKWFYSTYKKNKMDFPFSISVVKKINRETITPNT